MKQCPQCQKVYSDDIIYCLDDGSLLTFNINSFPTHNETPTVFFPKTQNVPQQPVNQPAKWIYPIIGIMSGLIVILAFLVAFPYLTAKEEAVSETSPNKNIQTDTSRNVSVPSPSVQTIIVEKEVPKTTNTQQTLPVSNSNQTTSSVVTVNSPRDGYLALKSEPCVAPCGTMLLKIPHGTRLTLGTCKANMEIADRRRGRWCFTNYGGYTGWIFDGFVTR